MYDFVSKSSHVYWSTDCFYLSVLILYIPYVIQVIALLTLFQGIYDIRMSPVFALKLHKTTFCTDESPTSLFSNLGPGKVTNMT